MAASVAVLLNATAFATGCIEEDQAGGQLRVLKGVAELASGESHTCALRDDGTVVCWGANDVGQLGTDLEQDAFEALDPVGFAQGTTIGYRREARPVQGLEDVQQLVAGHAHTCALLASGTVKCWGDSAAGQLGNGDFSLDECGGRPCSRQPVSASGLEKATQLSVGRRHSCAFDHAGRLSCWGSDAVGVASDRLALCDGVPCATAPMAVRTERDALQVWSGHSHSCALLSDGEVACWGSNAYGQLGVSDPPSTRAGGAEVLDRVETPARVALPAPAEELNLQSSNTHTCARLLDGQLYCWGRNDRGQLGTGTSEERCDQSANRSVACSKAPLNTSLDAPVERHFAGQWYSCALTADGALYCWGYAGHGQLGLPLESLWECEDGKLCARSPLQVYATEGRILDVALGEKYACILEEDLLENREVLCWGWGNPREDPEDSSQGRKSCTISSTPCTVEPSWSDPPERMAVTQRETLCVVTEQGEVHCFRSFLRGTRTIAADPMRVRE